MGSIFDGISLNQRNLGSIFDPAGNPVIRTALRAKDASNKRKSVVRLFHEKLSVLLKRAQIWKSRRSSTPKKLGSIFDAVVLSPVFAFED
jgi:hypothetical protein